MRFFALFMMSMGLGVLYIAALSRGEQAWYVCNYIEWLVEGGRAYRTVRTYLSGVRHLFMVAELDPPTDHAAVQRMMRAVKKHLKTATPKRIITVAMLRIWAGYFALRGVANPEGRYQRAIWATMLLAFHALLRGSEYAWKGRANKWSARDGLARADVRFDFKDGESEPAVMHVNIKHSKTDVMRHGAEFKFYATKGPLCVVAAVWASYRDGGEYGSCPSRPLFTARDGASALPYADITAAVKHCVVRMGLSPGDYGTHSFRSGGATALLAAGYDINYIKIMGRWSSDAWRRYIDLDISTIQDMARAMQFSTRERTPFFFNELTEEGTEALLRV